jgi:hypothetical protein
VRGEGGRWWSLRREDERQASILTKRTAGCGK